ncbi:putative NupC-like nucleoside permease [Candidatus Fokinia solitaria]|uniref:Putative NupC-like nucleoside permease n=1 Tax=Candidatus Fokinia solitaria TaxID=1802984 RepID=A0A2U8BRV6_9RICK|nr:nucleoside transporter C-terminal domain-containing protein [Candidatus Fokinia solitaria]AWD33086.1 putative NupC-like nucleoside permease [Candidatus Fokinia solitaria]
MHQLLLPLILFILIYLGAFLSSTDKKSVKLNIIVLGMAVQIGLSFLVMKVPSIISFFKFLSDSFEVITRATNVGVATVFGELALEPQKNNFGFVLALHGLPSLIVVSTLCSILLHLGILQKIMMLLSIFYKSVMRIPTVLSMGVAATLLTDKNFSAMMNRPYLASLSRGELFTMCVAGLAFSSVAIIAVYDSMLSAVVESAITHILSSIVISSPAVITIGRMMIPYHADLTFKPQHIRSTDSTNIMNVVQDGIIDGAKTCVAIIAIIIGMVALISLLNELINTLSTSLGYSLTIQKILGFVFMPIAFLLGIPASECSTAAGIIGTKIALNELLALNDILLYRDVISHNTIVTLIYACSNFANIGSTSLMVVIYANYLPNRKDEVTGFILKALVAAILCTLSTASLASFWLHLAAI